MLHLLSRVLPPKAVDFLCSLGACVLGSGLVAMGSMCYVAPSVASDVYGLPIFPNGQPAFLKSDAPPNAEAWVMATGLRDLSLGVATLSIQIFRRDALLFLVPSVLLVPLGDACITYASLAGEGRLAATAPHCFGSACVGALLLLLAVQRAQLRAKRQ